MSYVNPASPVYSALDTISQIVKGLPIKYPHVTELRTIVNTEKHDYRRKSEPDGPERAILGDVVSYIDTIPAEERRKYVYIVEIQKVMIEFMALMKQIEQESITLPSIHGLDFSRSMNTTAPQGSVPDTDGEIEIDRTPKDKRPPDHKDGRYDK